MSIQVLTHDEKKIELWIGATFATINDHCFVIVYDKDYFDEKLEAIISEKFWLSKTLEDRELFECREVGLNETFAESKGIIILYLKILSKKEV